MKQLITLRSIPVITCLLLGLSLHAQALTIHVETPGTLSSYIASNEKDLITSLTLTGDLNGTDIRFIREMAGCNPYGNYTDGKLSVLDISDANIVTGGDFYFYNTAINSCYYSTDNTIGDYILFDCTGLTSVTIPNSVTSIREGAFAGCTALTSFTIPSNVTSIGDYAFVGCSGLTSVTIPNSVTSIGGDSFFSCSGLTSVTIPNSVTSIGEEAFRDCIGLTSITIPNSVTSIGEGAFLSCSALTEIIVSEENSTFSSNEGVLFSKDKTILVTFPSSKSQSYTVPNSVISIGNKAFAGCSGLKSVSIPNSVTSIGGYAFSGCSGLTSVTIPNSVTSIGGGAFYYCIVLTSVTIPNSVTSIGSYAFCYCRGLTSVTIPNSVTSIGDHAFDGCSGLTFVTFPNNVTLISDFSFSGCSGLTSVTIPNSVTSIGSYAFFGCTGLTSVTIPNSLTSIGFRAFSSCSGLTSLTIPSSVTSIGEYAFSSCLTLTEIHNNNVTPQNIDNTVFNGVDKNSCILYVPKGSFSSYQAAPEWKDFATIMEEDLTSNPQIQTGNIKVYTEAEAILIEGAQPGETISVYTESGALIQTSQVTDDIVRINVPRGHSYLIKTTGKTFKVAL